MAISGSQIHAARALACWSRRELAARTDLNPETIRIWERSSDSAVRTTVSRLNSAIAAFAAVGIVITEDGVRKTRPVSTVLTSAGAPA